jgi:hypothetical protein
VVVTSDDESEEYQAQVRAQGWRLVDHEALGTKREHGPWAPGLVDAVVLSMGSAFVGVEESTSQYRSGSATSLEHQQESH